MTPVTPKAFLCTVLLQLGPNPEAVLLFPVDGGERKARLCGQSQLLSSANKESLSLQKERKRISGK